jgi:tol-pal system protein YbgF
VPLPPAGRDPVHPAKAGRGPLRSGNSSGNLLFPEEGLFWEEKLKKKDWIKGWMILGVILLLCGCASRRQVQVLDRDTNRLYSQMSAQQKEKESFQKDLENLQKEFKALQRETVDSKKAQADLQLRVENLQNEVRTLSTGIEEYKDLLKKPSKEMDRLKESIALRTKTLEDKEKIHEEKDKASDERLRVIEERLKGVEGKVGQLASKQSELEGALTAKEVSGEVKGGSTRAGDIYKDAYETFQKGDFAGARRKFETFLKQYPNTELSDNAQFWIGETYYLKKDYEKAILEYEKAIAKYPEGDKIPSALFKQALAFLELGDKTNGRNLLKRVTERYPNSDQAEMAKKKLETVK